MHGVHGLRVVVGDGPGLEVDRVVATSERDLIVIDGDALVHVDVVARTRRRLGPPIDITSRIAEVTYDLEWRPKSLHIDGVVRGQDVALKTTFAGGMAINSIAIQGKGGSPISFTPRKSAASAQCSG